MYGDPVEITEINVNSVNFSRYDFLAIDLKKSGLICLDVEGHPNSVENFYKLLERKRIDRPLLFIERSMNNGLHIYFRNDLNIIKSHWNKLGNIHYDILTKRAFTSPSSFNNKVYEWIHNDFNNIKSKDDIPKIPTFMIEFLENKEKYFKSKI